MNCFRPKVHFLSIMTDKRLISIQGFDFSKWSLQIWCVKLKVLSGANCNVKDLRWIGISCGYNLYSNDIS